MQSPDPSTFEADKQNVRFALTLGEQAEMRVGSTRVGNGLAEHGFSVGELQALHARLGGDLRVLSNELDPKHRPGNEAAVLLIKNGVNVVMQQADYADQMLREQLQLQYDSKYYDRRGKRTVNNRARLNTVFGAQDVAHSADYKQGTVIG